MTSNRISTLYFLIASTWFATEQAVAAGTIQLMEPIGGTNKLPACPGLGSFFKYFNLMWPLLLGSAAGIAVLMALVGGMQIIMSGGDQAGRQAGLDRFKNAMLGLLMCAFAGLLLRTLNPSFFKAGSVGAGGGC